MVMKNSYEYLKEITSKVKDTLFSSDDDEITQMSTVSSLNAFLVYRFSRKSEISCLQIVVMRVHMDCPGCETRVKKALKKLDGVDSVEIDMDMQKVTVTGYADPKKVLKSARKTGRQAELWPSPYIPEYHDFNYKYYNKFYRHPATYYAVEPSSAPFNPYSSYNYREHGYNGHDHGYFPERPSSALIADRTSDMFSDDNAHACSIM